MTPWRQPELPPLPQTEFTAPIEVFDVQANKILAVATESTTVPMYVCGITPYDATHIGHAATYVAFDTLNRLLRYSGHDVRLVINVTDVDDPLLERANQTGVDWQQLAAEQTDLYREDMDALGVIPPATLRPVTDELPAIRAGVRRLLDIGAAYRVPTADSELTPESQGMDDIYADLSKDDMFGELSHYSRDTMLEFFAERGGDPERKGKRDPLDPLLWRQARPGEPSWEDDILGTGRPGWHVECAVIAREHLDLPMVIQGGGSDLIFPHHEMSVSHLRMLADQQMPVQVNMNAAMVYLDGEKMSKSLGNLVFVSVLRNRGVNPMAIRLAILAHHYRHDWHWSDELLDQADERLQLWVKAANLPGQQLALQLWQILRQDMDTPGALAAVDAYCRSALENEVQTSEVEKSQPTVAEVVLGLLGVML